jgi:outer membrane translocation and assembly module TamA
MLRILALITLLFGIAARAQQHVLTIEADTALPRKWRGPFKVDSNLVGKRTAELRVQMIAKGYLEASRDSCSSQQDSTRCIFHLGQQYRWARLTAGSVPQEIASSTGFRERFYRDRPITPRQVSKLFEGLLQECEDHGYPFAAVGLDSLQATDDGLSASVHLDRGRYVTFDSVVVRGTAHVNPRYLQAYIGIRPGDAYNETLVRGLDGRTRELPFVSTRHPAYILFAPEQTKLYLFLDDKRASNFNGILGIAQDPVSGQVRFTGDLDLKLRNALHRGEAINLSWRSLQDRTQDLKVGFNYPFAFNTPFGADLGLKLFKRDTTFLEVTSRAALEYLLRRGDKVRVFVNNKNSQRLGQQVTYTPGLADVKLTAYGIGVQRERFDYRFNPRKGLAFDLEGSVGEKHSSTATFSDTTDTDLSSVQYELNGHVVWHIPLGRRSTVKIAGQGGSMVNDQLYSNELYRIGGIKTQRGVDEASIYASSFAIGTVEYRFLFEENSNFFVFVDQGWWEDQSRTPLLTDTPLGFGVGTSFETKAGIFSLSYALGKQFNNPVELRNGKIHFGFTSLF